MSSAEPFAVLGIEPTLEPSAVKRAYFAAVAQHPPHQDARAFGRIRAAYEMLTRPGGLSAAFLSSGVDVEALASAARQEWDAKLEAAAARARGASEQEGLVRAFVERCSRSSWEQMVRGGSSQADSATGSGA